MYSFLTLSIHCSYPYNEHTYSVELGRLSLPSALLLNQASLKRWRPILFPLTSSTPRLQPNETLVIYRLLIFPCPSFPCKPGCLTILPALHLLCSPPCCDHERAQPHTLWLPPDLLTFFFACPLKQFVLVYLQRAPRV